MINDTINDTNKKPKQPHWRQRLEQIIADGKPIPPVLADAMRANIRPFQVGIYDRLTDYMAANNYSDENISAMRICMANIVCTKGYHIATATDASQQFDLDGKPVGPVDPEDRLAARVALLGTDIRDAVAALEIATGKMSVLAKAAKQQAVPAPSAAPAPRPDSPATPPRPDSPATPAQKRISLPQVEIAKIHARRIGGLLEKASMTTEELLKRRTQLRGSR